MDITNVYVNFRFHIHSDDFISMLVRKRDKQLCIGMDVVRRRGNF
jgi:hypothetical protein